VSSRPIPNAFDRLSLLSAWVEKNEAPGTSVTVTAPGFSLPLCSYPSYPKLTGDDSGVASSYTCASK